jgi:DNA-binding IclR family transcriptional regulator
MAGRSIQQGRSVASKLACILAEFSADRARLRASEVCRRTGMPFSTVHRLLTELVDQELLEHLPDNTYMTSLKLWQIAAPQPDVSRLRHAALPAMCDLTVNLRSCVRLNVLVGAEGLCVEELCGAHDARTGHRFGVRFALHTTAGGHVLLAYARPVLREPVLREPSPLAGQLAHIRRTGVAMSRTGTHVSLSVPVFDDAAPVASLEVIAALPADVRRFVAAVRSAGERMSRAATPRSVAG